MKKQFLLFCTSVFIVLSACSKAGERGETGPQGPQGLPGKDLVAKPLFSFDTSRMKVTSISSPSFKSSNKTVTNIISDLPKIVAATVTADNNLLGIKTLVEDNTLTANVNKEFKTAATAGTNAVGIMVPFLGEGIKAGSTITIKIAGTLSEGTSDVPTAAPSVGLVLATKEDGTAFVASEVEHFSVLSVGSDHKTLIATSTFLPISKKSIKAFFLQVTEEETNADKKFFNTNSQVDIAISVKDGQHIDTKHIILKGVAAA